MMQKSFEDLSNQVFARWTVISRSSAPCRYVMFTCKCSCGSIKDVSARNLKNGTSKSCGCLKNDTLSRLNITGKRFGKLLVLRFHSLKNHNQMVECRCDCGSLKIVYVYHLNGKKKIKSCGCDRENSHACGGPGSRGWIPPNRLEKGRSGLNALFSAYNGGAKKRGLTFLLTIKDFEGITKSNCHYCGIAPSRVFTKSERRLTDRGKEWSKYTYNGVDRMDNYIGYEIKNCVPCCTNCNFAKRDMSYQDFIAYLDRLAQFRLHGH